MPFVNKTGIRGIAQSATPFVPPPSFYETFSASLGFVFDEESIEVGSDRTMIILLIFVVGL
ncbi:MAG: hypothetical protein IIC11_11030 [Proteobacteria bacterium]|nr:hypothetical protein [Pseudomonadota bacterium]